MGDHLPIHPSRALESMRNSDFDTKSAIGEAIDNSLYLAYEEAGTPYGQGASGFQRWIAELDGKVEEGTEGPSFQDGPIPTYNEIEFQELNIDWSPIGKMNHLWSEMDEITDEK